MFTLRFWPVLFVAMFFLPYLGETRVRVEVLLFAMLVFAAFLHSSAKKPYFLVLPSHVYVFAFGIFCYTFLLAVLSQHASLINQAIDVTNQNFLFLTLFGLLPLRHWLQANAGAILRAVVVISLLVNLVALFQAFFPQAPIQNLVFSLYGGEIREDGLASAEFLCRVAHRCTSIFPTLQALALFDLLIIALLMYLKSVREIGTVVFWVGMILAFLGGLATVSKTFMIGAPIAMLISSDRRQKFFFVMVMITLLLPIAAVFTLDYQAILGNNIVLIDNIKENGLSYIFASRFGGAGYGADGAFTELYDSMKDIPGIFITGVGSDYGYYGAHYTDNLYLQLIVYGGVPYAILFIVQYLMFFFALSNKATKAARRIIFAMAIVYFSIGFAYASFFIGRVSMLTILVLLVVTLDARSKTINGAR
ncbi:MAG: hypothetical protein QM488_09095 [Rhizobiaceae bacterium]